MKARKLNLEDFKENQLSRSHAVNIIGCAPVPPPVEVDEDGNPVVIKTNGDIKGSNNDIILIANIEP